MKRFENIARGAIVVAALLALLPLGRMAADWVRVNRVVSQTDGKLPPQLNIPPLTDAPPRGYDWVSWKEEDGLIHAAFVFHRPGQSEPVLREGDIFLLLDYQPYFTQEDLQQAIEGIPPGSVRTYTVRRGDEQLYIDVRFTRYPTFLYPLSPSLWQFSIWGFVFGAFFHLIGLVIVVPLARRSRAAQFSVLLISVSSLWMFGNLLRILMVQVLGPLEAGSTSEEVFQALTLMGLVGWIGFPALLLWKVLGDAQRIIKRSLGPLCYLPFLPALLLGLAALLITLRGSIGPLTLDGLIAPILFYACCYIGTAAAFMLALSLLRPAETEEVTGGWPRLGSALMLGASFLFGLSILGVVPLIGAVTETMSGWLVVGAQLLSVVPVVLVSLATLKHGKVDQVLSRALTYLTVLGLIFFAFVGGMTLVEPYLIRLEVSRTVVAGLYVVLLLIVFERLARRMRVYTTQFFATERQEARQRLSRFQKEMRDILDHETLARVTIETIGEAFKIQSGRFFLRPGGLTGPWYSAAYHPVAPYLTERIMELVWPHFQREGTIWARNPELNESHLPDDLSMLLLERNIALAVPLQGDGSPIGLLVLGEKKQRRAVFNLEDLDMLRSLSGQLGLAVERLHLVERERALVRESAEAQLSALRAQINPHFLFNALNTIVALIEEQPDQAVEAVEHLAAIFRHILHTGGQPFVSVQDEFALVSHYLSIEQARFGDRLAIERRLDPHLRSLPVPAFAVQTLVENAVKHGLEKRRDGGTLRLICRRVDPLSAEPHEEMAEILVSDSGIGIPALFGQQETAVTDADFMGIGLRNVAARLEKLYDRTDLLRMESTPEGGTTARLLLPLTPADTPRPFARIYEPERL